jgi:hypothetical protein
MGLIDRPGRRNMKVPEDIEDLRRNIHAQLADMSRLLEMMSNDDDVVHEARTSFLKLSALIGRALDIELQ